MSQEKYTKKDRIATCDSIDDVYHLEYIPKW